MPMFLIVGPEYDASFKKWRASLHLMPDEVSGSTSPLVRIETTDRKLTQRLLEVASAALQYEGWSWRREGGA